MIKTIVIATGNLNKLREIKQIFSGCNLKFLSLDDIKFKGEIAEIGKNFSQNAILKAKTVGDYGKNMTLAEDSGLEVDALGGQPGVYSARYAQGMDKDRVNYLLRQMLHIPKEKRQAKFVAVIALYDPHTGSIKLFRGESRGCITQKPLGKNGFGYDPVFYNLQLGKTNAQASAEEKNLVSHRAIALRKMKKYLLEKGILGK